MSQNKDVQEEVEEVVEDTKTNTEEVKEEAKKENSKKNEIKNEATDAVKQVKEQMKDVNIKEEAKVAKGFISEFVKNPIEKITNIANDSKNTNFKTAIILTIVWALATVFSSYSFKYFEYRDFFDCVLDIVKLLVAPVLVVVAMSAVIYFLSRKWIYVKFLDTFFVTHFKLSYLNLFQFLHQNRNPVIYLV